MTSAETLLDSICRNPDDVRFADALKTAGLIDFHLASVKGSHHVLKRESEMERLNFQKWKGGKIPGYQGRQLKKMIEKYWSTDEQR